MAPRRIAAVALALLLLAPLARAADPVDLSAFFDPGGRAGDHRVYRASDGSTRTLRVRSAAPQDGAIRYEIETLRGETLIGCAERLVVPGRRELAGGDCAARPGEPFEFRFGAPRPVAPFRMLPGKPYRYQRSARILFEGAPVGALRIRGVLIFHGFEARFGHGRSDERAARLTRVESSEADWRDGGVAVRAELEETFFLAEGVGNVASVERRRLYVDGALHEDSGAIEHWLERGVVAGRPLR